MPVIFWPCIWFLRCILHVVICPSLQACVCLGLSDTTPIQRKDVVQARRKEWGRTNFLKDSIKMTFLRFMWYNNNSTMTTQLWKHHLQVKQTPLHPKHANVDWIKKKLWQDYIGFDSNKLVNSANSVESVHFKLQDHSGTQKPPFWPSKRVSKHTLMKPGQEPSLLALFL